MTKKKDIIHRNYFKENNEGNLEMGKMIYLYNPIEPEMIWVEGGTFKMGATSEQGNDYDYSEKPAHVVTLSGFMIGKYQVTQAHWKAIMGNDPSYYTGYNLPVECVSWNEVQDFIVKLNAQTGKQYRLPTETEWEFAARGGKKSKGYKYSGSNNPDEVAWYKKNITHPVGTKLSNELGIYDMSGNIFEWCSDWFDTYESNEQTNPQGPSLGSGRVIRGGAWCSNARNARVSYRSSWYPDYRRSDLGFRLARNSK